MGSSWSLHFPPIENNSASIIVAKLSRKVKKPLQRLATFHFPRSYGLLLVSVPSCPETGRDGTQPNATQNATQPVGYARGNMRNNRFRHAMQRCCETRSKETCCPYYWTVNVGIFRFLSQAG